MLQACLGEYIGRRPHGIRSDKGGNNPTARLRRARSDDIAERFTEVPRVDPEGKLSSLFLELAIRAAGTLCVSNG